MFNLLSGNVDALIYPEPALLLIARQINVDDQIRSEGTPLVEILRGISVQKGDESLLEILNPAIQTLLSSDKYGEIYARWYGRTKPFWSPRRVFIAMSIVLMLAVLLLLIWKNLSTERLVKKRTAQLSFQGQLMSQVRDGVIPIDRDGHILGWNRGAQRLFLYKEQDMKGSSIYELLDEKEGVILEKAIRDHGPSDQA